MSTLVAGYESSDEEVEPLASTSASTFPIHGHHNHPPDLADEDEDDEENDEQLQEQAREDAFGLFTSDGKANGNGRAGLERRTAVMAAPDVLKEVSGLARTGFGR
jgi:hypothetical protein